MINVEIKAGPAATLMKGIKIVGNPVDVPAAIAMAKLSGDGTYTYLPSGLEFGITGTVVVPPAPPPPPPAPNPPAPPPATGLLPSVGNNFMNKVYLGPIDLIDPNKMMLPIEYTAGIPLSLGGKEATRWFKTPLCGVPSWLYEQTPHIRNNSVWRTAGQLGDDILLNVMPRLTGSDGKPPYPLQGGPRGKAIGTPYTAWHGHSPVRLDGSVNLDMHLPLYVGVVPDGTVMDVRRDGSMNILFKIDVPKGGYINDFTYFEPRAQNIFYVVNAPMAQIIEVNRGNATTPPSTRVVLEGKAQGFRRITSIRQIGIWLYFCDPDVGGVYRFEPLNKAVEFIAALPGAFWIDYDSKGNAIVATLSRTVHRIDSARNVSADLLGKPGGGQSWVTVSVDRNGTCGEVDSILALSTHGAGNVDSYRITSAGVNKNGYGQGGGNFSVGDLAHVGEALGHYPWNAEYHPYWAIVLVQGFAELIPGFVCPLADGQTLWPEGAKRTQEVRIDGTPFELGQFAARGLQAWIDGGMPADKGKVPSFTAQLTPRGMGLVTFEHITLMSHAGAEAFIRAGMLGNVPRNIDKWTMCAMRVWAAIHTQFYAQRGKVLIDEIFAYTRSLP